MRQWRLISMDFKDVHYWYCCALSLPTANMNMNCKWLWFTLLSMILLVGALILRYNSVYNAEYLAHKYGVALGSGVSFKIQDIKLGFTIDMKEPMEIRTAGSRSLVSPVGSSSFVDKNIVYYQEARLVSINSNGCAIRFTVNWQPVSNHEVGKKDGVGKRFTNTVFFYYGQITQTNISGVRVIGQYEK